MAFRNGRLLSLLVVIIQPCFLSVQALITILITETATDTIMTTSGTIDANNVVYKNVVGKTDCDTGGTAGDRGVLGTRQVCTNPSSPLETNVDTRKVELERLNNDLVTDLPLPALNAATATAGAANNFFSLVIESDTLALFEVTKAAATAATMTFSSTTTFAGNFAANGITQRGLIRQWVSTFFFGGNSVVRRRLQSDRQLQVGAGTIVQLCIGFCPASANGDPHFLRWGQSHHDSFHGECDMVLASSKKNEIDIHLRTKRRRFYSYIKKMGIRIGNHMLEIGKNFFTIDGVTRAHNENLAAFPLAVPALPGSNNGAVNTYSLTVHRVGDKEYKFSWSNSTSAIVVSVTGRFLNVEVEGGHEFADSIGMMGEFGSGRMLDRHGKPMDPKDMNAFGMEWQVKYEMGDTHVFSSAEGPQWPEQKCLMPEWSKEDEMKKQRKKRNLRANKRDILGAAQLACAGVVDYELCVEDVTVSGEIGLAKSFGRKQKAIV